MTDNRFLIFGAGAIGTYLGASLTRQGSEVVFLEREKDIPELRDRGLRMEIEDQVISIPDISFLGDLQKIRGQEFTLGILALKTYHLESILPDLVRAKDLLPPLLCLQNGVESEGILAGAVGEELVIPGTVTSAVDRIQKGEIVVRKKRGMGIAGTHPLVKDLLEIFNEADLTCRYYRRADAMKWSKLLTNLLGNASSAILDLTTEEIYSDKGLFKVELQQIREALRVMRELGVSPLNLPGVPVRVLAGVVRWLPPAISQPLLSWQVGGGRGEKMPSFHIDLYSGRGKSEVDQLNGAVIRAGERTGCPAPVNHFLTRTLTSLMKGEIPLDRYRHNPSQFLQDLQDSLVSE
ncbi:MAG: ketopantoate reductase family protein [Anaerolineales bacterium]